MAFKVNEARVDLITEMITVTAAEQQLGSQFKSITVQFPFKPSGSDSHEKDRVIAEAKQVLQQALSEI